MQTLLQNLLNGIAAGSIYALIALGYTMVYGILKLINFAHGDIFMIGSFVGFYVGNAITKANGGNASPVSAAIVMILATSPAGAATCSAESISPVSRFICAGRFMVRVAMPSRSSRSSTGCCS